MANSFLMAHFFSFGILINLSINSLFQSIINLQNQIFLSEWIIKPKKIVQKYVSSCCRIKFECTTVPSSVCSWSCCPRLTYLGERSVELNRLTSQEASTRPRTYSTEIVGYIELIYPLHCIAGNIHKQNYTNHWLQWI